MQRRGCFIAMRFSVSLFFTVEAWEASLGIRFPDASDAFSALSISSCERVSLSSPLYLKTCSFQLSMWNQTGCQYPRVKPQHASFQGRGWKGGVNHLGTTAFQVLFWTCTRVCIEHLRDVIWQNRGSFSRCLLKLGPNPVSPPLRLPLCKTRASGREACTFPERQESPKQSWDSGSSIRSCLLLLNCKKWIVSPESAPVLMQSIDQLL